MPSPVLPNDFCSLKPSAGTDVCDAMKTLLFSYPDLLCEFFTWMLNADGSITDEFKEFNRQVPPGTITGYGSLSAPDGWLLCNGQAVSRTTYATLFLAIGSTWGAGDGVTTFNVPDAQSRSLMGMGKGVGLSTRTLAEKIGEETHALTAAENGPHNHANGDFKYLLRVTGLATGASGDASPGEPDLATPGEILESGSGTGHNTVHPVLIVPYIIKT